MVEKFAATWVCPMRKSPDVTTWYLGLLLQIKGQRKLFHVPRIFTIATTAITGFDRGRTMFQ